MSIRVTYSTPLLRVADIERSIQFYGLLGFKTIDTDGANPLGWARLHCESGSVMFVRAGRAIDAKAQGFLFYLYTPDLAGLRRQLQEEGVMVPEIQVMDYMPSGMINFRDPDGYILEIGHWGAAEQADWEKHLEERRAAD